jgi:hypothetical protein
MPQDTTDWVRYAPVRNFSPDKFISKATETKCSAFHDSSFKRLFGKLFDSLLKDERMI